MDHPSTHPFVSPRLGPLAASFRATIAANDTGTDHSQTGRGLTDLNALVGRVVGHLAAVARPEGVSIELDLAHGVPFISGRPSELAFAIAGVLGRFLRSLDETDDGVVRVETRADSHSVRINILGDGIPPLGMVRALSGNGNQGADPTMCHCRRLIEAQDGHIELTDQTGLLGFAIEFPAIPLSRPVTVKPLRLLRPVRPMPALEMAA